MRYKKISIFIAILMVVITGYAVNADYYYPALNTDAVQFLIKDKPRISEKDNSFYSMIGLNAPKDVQDIHEFGLNLVNDTLNNCLDEKRKYLPLDTKLPTVKNEITLNGEVNKLQCWLDIEANTANGSKCAIPQNDSCYTESELSEVVKNNSILLNRHEQLNKYKKNDYYVQFATNGQLLINTHRLYLANIRLNIEQGREQTVQVLIQDLEHQRDSMSQSGTMIDKAIKMVLYNLSLEQLEHVIIKHTDVALKYKNEIAATLRELPIEEFNLDAIFREEFEILNSIYCIDERLGIDTPDYCQNEVDVRNINVNYIINNYYEFYLSYKSMSKLDMQSMTAQCSAYSNESKENIYLGMLLHLPILTTYTGYTLVLGGMIKGCELMVTHKQKSLKHTELLSYLNSKTNNGEVLNVQQ